MKNIIKKSIFILVFLVMSVSVFALDDNQRKYDFSFFDGTLDSFTMRQMNENYMTAQRILMDSVMVNYSPVLAMRYAIAWYIFNEYHKDEYAEEVGQKSSVKESKLPEVTAPVKYDDSDVWYTGLYLSYTNAYAKTEWSYVNGSWKVSSLKKVNFKQLHNGPNTRMNRPKEKVKKAKVEREIPEGKSIELGSIKIFAPNLVSASYGARFFDKNINSWAHIVDVEVNLLSVLALDFTGIINETTFAVYTNGEKARLNDSIDLFAGVQAQLPVYANNFVAMPYATVQAGAQYSFADGNKFYVVERNEFGARCNYFFGTTNVSLFLDGNFEVEYNISKAKLGTAVTVSAGVTF